MDSGKALTIWLARGSAALYLCALACMAARRPRPARTLMTLALALYLAHVVGAFEYFYSWSHGVALRETARQTAELFGVNWGGGLYLNYVFTALWLLHSAMWWQRSDASLPRGTVAAHAFLLFMFINGTVVVWVLRAMSSIE